MVYLILLISDLFFVHASPFFAWVSDKLEKFISFVWKWGLCIISLWKISRVIIVCYAADFFFHVCLELLCLILFCTNFQVFSAFGYVHKIATFEKAAGFQVS